MVNYTPKLVKVESDLNNSISTHVLKITNASYKTLTADMNVAEAIDIITKNKLTGAPVVNSSGHLEGYLSAKDCLKFNLDMKYYNESPGLVKNYMSKKLITLNQNDSILHIVELFINNHYQAYPVMDNGRYVGMVTRQTILETVNKLKQTTW
jgi:predicted transcriptional regulator